jgi:hypothetical protein
VKFPLKYHSNLRYTDALLISARKNVVEDCRGCTPGDAYDSVRAQNSVSPVESRRALVAWKENE